MYLVIWAASFIFGTALLAQQPKLVEVNLTPLALELQQGNAHTLRLSEIKRVQKLKVDAEGVREDAIFEVVVNGEVKGTIYVPARDPEYIVTIAESTESIVLRHKQGGRVRILKAIAYVAPIEIPQSKPRRPTEPLPLALRSQAAQLATEIIALCDELVSSPNSTRVAIAEIILPIKRAAGRAYAAARANGDLSAKVHQKLELLKSEIQYADTYFEEALNDPDRFDLVVNLLTKREELAAMID
jgi:hypothetical protein